MEKAGERVVQRLRLTVQGMVQGVGLRSFIYALARNHGLAGFVLNDNTGVTIEIEGTQEKLKAFQHVLNTQTPPSAHLEYMYVEQVPILQSKIFYVAQSRTGKGYETPIASDCSVCDDCLREVSNPKDRRYQYPFTNCANCGPRFTIVQNGPYERGSTTMHPFQLCPTCQMECDDPLSRRFRTQSNACPDCGPQARLLVWHNPDSLCPRDQLSEYNNEYAPEPATQAALLLSKGAILAVKGLGGYALTCDAFNASAVRCLRRRKQCEGKPLALMVPDLATTRALCLVSEAEAKLLEARQRPIVLLTPRPESPLTRLIAPECDTLGIMLPYTPLHYLLLRAFADLHTANQPAALVMTGGKVKGEPLIYRDDEAWRQLKPLVDGMLTHNREIYTRCDDAVLRFTAGATQFIRRARGYTPEPIELSFEIPAPLLACGGYLRNTFCLGQGQQAVLSPHMGNLENPEALHAFRRESEHFQRLFAISPVAVAHDLHPSYLASRYALSLKMPHTFGIQHHHAHIASVMAEHGLEGPLLGIAADGAGYGTDGAVWGCEIMRADLGNFQRLAHLAYVPLPGGEQAVRQPWRMATAYLQLAYGAQALELDIPFMRQLNRARWRSLTQIIEKGIHCPLTSSLGRLFDAVAALLGLAPQFSTQRYDGQAANALERLARTDCTIDRSYPFTISDEEPATFDVIPLIRALVDDIKQEVPAARIARRFHTSIATLLAQSCARARRQTGLSIVALSGDSFQNQLLLEQLIDLLEKMAFLVFINRRVPPNDGGLSLGQLAIAATRLRNMYAQETSKRENRPPEQREAVHASRHSRCSSSAPNPEATRSIRISATP